MSAASSGVIVGKESYIFVGAIIGVRTSGMWIVVKVTLSPIVSEDVTRVKASSAALQPTYSLNRGGVRWTAIEGSVTSVAPPWSCMFRCRSIISLTGETQYMRNGEF